MCWLRKGSQARGIVLLLAIVYVVGCSTLPSSLPSSGIDPSGDSVFLSPPPCNPFVYSNTSSSATYSPPYAGSTYTTSASNPPQLGKTSGTKVLPRPLLGESYDNYPTARLQWDNTDLVVTPGRIAAPVGSQVVLKAGVVAPDKYLSMNEEVQWSLTSGSVGQFVEIDPGAWKDLCFGDFTFPRKISPLQAVTSTSRNNLNLNRGTPVKSDDVKVRRGETWVTVSSPVEGTSFITARAPSVYDWNLREKTAIIHWIDAQWEFPAPSFAPAGGRQVLMTKLSRNSDHQPLVGWRVRYTITGGPTAGFAPDGTKATEVVTNSNGEAIVEIVEDQAVAGTSQIAIEVVRPDGGKAFGIGGGAETSAITVGNGSTMVTWSAPELSLTKNGPRSVVVGSKVTYQINVTNPGDLPADDVQIVDQIPVGAKYLSSSPPSQEMGTTLRWEMGRLNPGETRCVQVNLGVNQAGTIESCAEATAVGGLTARDCVTTHVGSPKLDIKVYCLNTNVHVGDIVSFDIDVRNVGQVAATNLRIVDSFDEGLLSNVPGAMEDRKIKRTEHHDIQPGKLTRIRLDFRATRPGHLCHTVTITDGSNNKTTAQGCVDVAPASDTGVPTPAPMDATTPRTSAGDGYTPPGTQPQASVSITKTRVGPKQVKIGDRVLFDIEVKNIGQADLTNLMVVDTYDPQFAPLGALPQGKFGPGQNQVHWKIDSLAPGQHRKYQVECETRGGPTGVAINQARVTTDQRVESTSKAEVTIIEPTRTIPGTPSGTDSTVQPHASSAKQGNLVLSVYDNGENFPVRAPYDYTVEVENRGTVADQNVVLTVDLSPGLILKRSGTSGMSTESHSMSMIKKVENQKTVTFEPILKLKPGETIRYQVWVEPTVPGQEWIKAVISSRNVSGLQYSDTTNITQSR